MILQEFENDREQLHEIWANALQPNKQTTNDTSVTRWNEYAALLAKWGRARAETVNFLYRDQPTFDDFKSWLTETFDPSPEDTPANDVLSADEMAAWDRDGYIVVKNAATPKQCADARNAIWDYLDATIDDPASWYKHHDGISGLMIELFQHPALNAIRRSGRIRKVFMQLYGDQAIYPLIDKASFNPPLTPFYNFKGSALHWDVSLAQPIPYVLQGLVYLTDTTAADGAFSCVPGFHNQVEAWVASMATGTDPRAEAVKTLTPVAIPGNAGDLVIWQQALPHCATANKGKTPRMVHYVTYKPVYVTEHQEWI